MQLVKQIDSSSTSIRLEFFSSNQKTEIQVFACIDECSMLIQTLACKVNSLGWGWFYGYCSEFQIPLEFACHRTLVRADDCAAILEVSNIEVFQIAEEGNLSRLIIHKLSKKLKKTNAAIDSLLSDSFFSASKIEKIRELALTVSHLDFEVYQEETERFNFILRKRNLGTIDLGFFSHLIGKGNTGTVYKTHILGIDRVFALKIFSSKIEENTVKKQINDLMKLHQIGNRLSIQEAPLAIIRSKCRVVGFLGAFYEEGDFFEAIANRSFREVKQIPIRKTLEMINPIIETLLILQRENILLLDLSPENIFMLKNNRAVIGDYGCFATLHTNPDLVDFDFSVSFRILQKDTRKYQDLIRKIKNRLTKRQLRIAYLEELNQLLKKIQVFEVGILLFFALHGRDKDLFPFNIAKFGLEPKPSHSSIVFEDASAAAVQSIIFRMLESDSTYSLDQVLEDLKNTSNF